MLTTGKRVTVVNSSTSRKGACVRRGSAGFVISTDDAYVHMIDKKRILITPIHMAFSRFGFEKRRRQENKRVCAVLPLFAIDCDNAKSTIDGLLLSLARNKHIKNFMIDYGVDTLVTIKLSPIDVLKNECEFSNWLISIMCSPKFNINLMKRSRTKFNMELFNILNYVGLRRPLDVWLTNKKVLSKKLNNIFEHEVRYELFKLLHMKLSLYDMEVLNHIAKKRLEDGFISFNDIWFMSLLNNNSIKLSMEESKLATVASSMNKILMSL